MASDAVAFLRRHGGRLMTPQPSAHHEGHYCSYIEAALREDLATGKPLGLDAGLPSLKDKDSTDYLFSACNAYVFRSKADETRHKL